MVDFTEENNAKYLEHLMNTHQVVSKGTIDLANSGAKICLLINGVAIVSLLTFTSGLDFNGENIDPGEVEKFFTAYYPFIFGIISAALAATTAFLHQDAVANEVHTIIYHALILGEVDYPKKGWFRIKTKDGDKSGLGIISIISIVASILFFSYGSHAVLMALMAMHLAK